jgi:RNA polymerase sigma factor (sigma-70 family)
MAGDRIEGILRCFTAGEADTGWIRFLDAYSPLLRDIVRQYEDDESCASECFAFVCGKLSDDGFRRLTAFRPDGPARFRTWLAAVAANLCIDWRRSEYGRYRAPGVIGDLPELDQLVFDCVYRQGMTRQECLQVLKAGFPKINAQKISYLTAKLHNLLSSRQRWQLSRSRTRETTGEEAPESLAAAEKGPEALAQSEQDRERLKKALSRLEPRQRLFLQLRYQQDLTLDEVARLMGVKDPYTARRRIESALAALARAMKF